MVTKWIRSPYNWFLIALIAAFIIVVLRNAWVSDDAYITFRTVDNFVNGLGLTWNAGERVQAYTHPLWMFLISSVYLFTREAFYTSIFLSATITLLAIIILSFRIAKAATAAILGVLVLMLSKAFIDYSTSGLENALSHLLVALFALLFLKSQKDARHLLYLALLAALIGMTRLDLLLIVIPAFAYEFWQRKGLRSVGYVVVGFLPLLAWHLFSLFYYGWIWPNTAYAKLGAGIEWTTLAQQGFHYLSASLVSDPLTLAIPAAVGIAVVVSRRKPLIFLWLGTLLYLLYVVRIGGCFMSGRMLTVPLFLCVVVLVQWEANLKQKSWWVSLIAVLFIGLTMTRSPLYTTASYGADKEALKFGHGIVDERGWYFQQAGLLNAGGKPMPSHRYARQGRRQNRRIMVRSTVGYYGYFAGPDTYVVDICGLGDALIARLPFDTTHTWRIGHNFRAVPDGYRQTVASNENRISNPHLRGYYNHLMKVIRGPLFDRRRLETIVDFNLGRYDHLLERYSREE